MHCSPNVSSKPNFSWTHFYCPQRSWGKVIFSEACVKNSVHKGGGSGSVQAGPPQPRADTPPWEQTPPPGADTPSPPSWEQTPDTPLIRSRHPPEQCMLGDTGNKRAVRILLECILVHNSFVHQFKSHLMIPLVNTYHFNAFPYLKRVKCCSSESFSVDSKSEWKFLPLLHGTTLKPENTKSLFHVKCWRPLVRDPGSSPDDVKLLYIKTFDIFTNTQSW